MCWLPRCAVWIVSLVCLGSVSVALGADPAGDGKAPAKSPLDKPTAVKSDPAVSPSPRSDGAEPDRKPLREQTIYVPYEKLREVFEQKGRGVFLPYEQFQSLWEAAQRQTASIPEGKPPVASLITQIEAEATASKDVVGVRAVIRIDVLAQGWHEIPLRLGDSAITLANLAGQPAKLLGTPETGYRLLIENKEKAAKQHELILEFAKAITKVPGQNSVAFQVPEAAVNRWRVRIPEAGVKVNVQPMVAATQPPVDQDGGKKATEETVLLAFVGATPTVRIEWTPKSEGATGMEALTSVQCDQQVWISEGVTRTRARLGYSVSRAELSQLTLEVPSGHKVVNVLDPNVRQWTVQQEKEGQRVTVQLFEPVKQSQVVTLELEQFTAAQETSGTFRFPVIKALGVGRQQGIVGVDVGEGLRAEALRATGLLQLDPSDLPPGFSGGKWAFSYRYVTAPFELLLSLEKVEPRVLVDTLVEAALEPDRLTLDCTLFYQIERAGLFRLELDIPEGFEVRSVRGREAGPVAAAQVEGHHRDGTSKNRLVVDLGRKAMGRMGLSVQLQRELQEPALTTPSEKSATLAMPMVRVPAGMTERTSGNVLVYAPESLRVNPAKTEGLRSVTFKEALQTIPSARSTGTRELRPVLAFAYIQDGVSLAVQAQRRSPQVTMAQLLVARIEDGVVKYQASFRYSVRYSGVKSLRIDVPQSVASRMRNHSSGIREQLIQPSPGDVAPGYAAWRFAGESELLGDGRIELAWEDEGSLGKLELGKPMVLKVPRLIPRDVDRAWGQVVLTKTETIDIQESGELQGLRPIDPQRDLMPGASVPTAARAFEFHDDWALSIAATRYQLEDVRRTSIERAVVQMVITAADQVSVRALYRIRSAQQRLELELPAQVQFDTEPVRINGRPLGLERGEQGRLREVGQESMACDQYFIPLVDLNSEESCLLEIRYLVPRNGGRLDLPHFPSEPAVQKVYLCVYLPQQKVLIDKRGPWTDEFSWDMDGGDWVPVLRRSDGALLEWVQEGLPKGSRGGDGFQTDRHLYVFSNLHPAAPPEGSLYLTLANDTWLSLAVVAGVLGLGLVLLPVGAGTRAFWLGVGLVALVLCGLFWPIAAWQIADGRLMGALLIVAAVWTVYWFTRTKQMRTTIKRASTSAGASASAAPDASLPSSPEVASPASQGVGAPDQPITAESVVEDHARPRSEGQEGGPSHG